MNLIDKIALVGQRMKSEQISLKESLLASSRVSVSDDSVEGVDRLIYNHCLNKKISPTSLENLELPSIKFSLISKKKAGGSTYLSEQKPPLYPLMSRILWMPRVIRAIEITTRAEQSLFRIIKVGQEKARPQWLWL